ncbi:hypothetical protein C2E23DRAFT_821605 [Lenzites betulinus]|nr:hypothetical protein C2E23DRAFT_821605 [Lenzites betulinus]
MLSFVTLAASVGVATAGLTPTAPGPGDSFAAGSDCTIKWNADTTGQWTNTSIYLMSGANSNMTRVAKVVSGMDGTDPSLSPYTWTCPEVDPYSTIYFYQFTNGDDIQDSSWTTRFKITSPEGASQPPEHDTQPEGDAVPWGEGQLASDGQVTAQADASGDPSSDDGDQDDDNGSVAIPTSTRTHKHDDTAPSGTPDSSSARAASSLQARPSHPSGSGAAAEDTEPTASLPIKKAHAPRTGTVVGPTSSQMPSSSMGPGVSQMGGMELANTAGSKRGSKWFKTVSLYFALVAMLL